MRSYGFSVFSKQLPKTGPAKKIMKHSFVVSRGICFSERPRARFPEDFSRNACPKFVRRARKFSWVQRGRIAPLTRKPPASGGFLKSCGEPPGACPLGNRWAPGVRPQRATGDRSPAEHRLAALPTPVGTPRYRRDVLHRRTTPRGKPGQDGLTPSGIEVRRVARLGHARVTPTCTAELRGLTPSCRTELC
jgi:hypothetical protein